MADVTTEVVVFPATSRDLLGEILNQGAQRLLATATRGRGDRADRLARSPRRHSGLLVSALVRLVGAGRQCPRFEEPEAFRVAPPVKTGE